MTLIVRILLFVATDSAFLLLFIITIFLLVNCSKVVIKTEVEIREKNVFRKRESAGKRNAIKNVEIKRTDKSTRTKDVRRSGTELIE